MTEWKRPLRPLAPRKEDLRKWRRLVREARAAVADPQGAGGDLRAAAATACRAVAPSHELLVSTCSPLIRLSEVWPSMDVATRAVNVDRLLYLAQALDAVVGTPGPAVDVPVETEARPPRADIYG